MLTPIKHLRLIVDYTVGQSPIYHHFRSKGQIRSLSVLPRLESASARARKRRRRSSIRLQATPEERSRLVDSSTGDNLDKVPAYPKGKPWRVLWPHPHDNPSNHSESKPVRRFPRWKDIQNGWKGYRATWEDGLRGEPSPEKLRQRELELIIKEGLQSKGSNKGILHAEINGTNISQNLELAREKAQELAEQAKERTGIRNQDDLRKVASDAMKIATECLKEFMAGYRQGRDEEVDKMLHEYFQDQDDSRLTESGVENVEAGTKTRRRKAKRALLRN